MFPKKRITKHVTEVGIMAKDSSSAEAINLQLTWTNTVTGQIDTITWHQINCLYCDTTFESWKQHAFNDHLSKEISDKNEKDNKQKRSCVKNDVVCEEVKPKNRDIEEIVTRLCDNIINSENCGDGNMDTSADTRQPKDINQSFPVKGKRIKRLPLKKETIQSTPMRYKCRKRPCEQMFQKLRDRREHESTHKEIHAFKCQYADCQESFPTNKALIAHKVIHSDTFTCRNQDCNETFNEKFERLAHERKHKHFCHVENCSEVFETKVLLFRHLRTHKNNSAFCCSLCGKSFRINKYLRKHLETHKSKDFQCGTCDKVFRNDAALKVHQRLHTGEGLSICQFCGKKINGKASLDRHERLHTGVKPFKCSFCDKRFISCNAQKIHEQEHTGYQFVCVHCGNAFKSKANLVEHERVHTGETPFHCKICKLNFRSASRLWTHNKVHSDERFTCSVCKKEFMTRYMLNSHAVIHTDKKPYTCKYCHKRFSQNSGLSAHVKQVHMGIKRVGHQGKAKRLKEEAKELKCNQNEVYTSGFQGSSLVSVAIDPNKVTGPTSKYLAKTLSTMIPPLSEPLNLTEDLKQLTQTQPAHSSQTSSRSNFYTTVEPLSQFSEEL